MRYIDERLEFAILTSWVRGECLTIDVVGYGVRAGYLTVFDAIAIELRRMQEGVSLGPREEQVALALADDTDRVSDLLAGENSEHTLAARHVWFYAGARQLLSEWVTTEEPREQLAALIDVLRLSAEYPDLLYYTPMHRGGPHGPEGLIAGLKSTLVRLDSAYGKCTPIGGS